MHVADSVEEMNIALAQVSAGTVPATPFLLTGQMTTTDPTRSPAGTESFWAYTHVPAATTGDAGGDGIRGTWDRDDCERMADRMQARVERLAPGFGARVRARRVLGPRELEARDANLVGGALNGGTAQLHQQLVLRPVPGPRSGRDAGPRASSSAPRRPTRAAASTARAATTPPGPRSRTLASAGYAPVDDGG